MQNQNKLRWWQVLLSVAAAFFGVQSNRVRERDFQSSSAWPFIIVGIILTVLLVIILASIVSLVI